MLSFFKNRAFRSPASPPTQESRQKQIVNKVHDIFKDFAVRDNTDYEPHGTASLTIFPKVTKPHPQNCLRFKFNGYEEYKILHIDNISNCNGTTGNMFLELLDDFVNTLSFVETIRITSDVSKIQMCGIQISLANLHILTSENGESWYNKHGYVNAYTESDKTLNTAFGSTAVNKVFDFLHYRTSLNGIIPIVTDGDEEIIKEIKEKIESYLRLDISVRDCVTHFSKFVRKFDKNTCNKNDVDQVVFLQKLVDLFSKYVTYHSFNLDKTKKVSVGQGGNKRKHKSKHKLKIHKYIMRRQTYRNIPSSKVRNTNSARFRQMKMNENSLRRRK
jgi:hypothetical protein